MLTYKHTDGRTMEVHETELAKMRVLARSGWTQQKDQPVAKPVESPQVESVVTDDLPEDFPERQALTDAGYGALLLVRKATDEELRAIPGISKSKVEKIRAAV
jgi:DNA uptake protein ComE-like DNA-binding protein